MTPHTASYSSSVSAYDIAIVGGGITGLSAAWYLERGARAAGLPLRYTLLEESGRWGGVILTETVAGPEGGRFVVEAGPDSFITQKPWALELARELGLEERLLGTNDSIRKVYVLNRGRPTPMPEGVLLIVPTRFKPFVLSPLLSPWGKLRMGLDLLIPPKRDDQDETLADFVRRRLGTEALNKIAEPLLSGIYNSEAERQSIMATFPRFRALEAQYGSLTRGMLASRRNHRGPAPGPAAAGRKPLSVFMSLRGGTGELVEALAGRLTGDLRLNSPVRKLERAAAGGYRLLTGDGRALQAGAVVLAIPAYAAARLVEEMEPRLARGLAAIRYVSTGTVSLAFPMEAMERAPRGFGIVVPRNERRPINAITWSSLKFDGRAPEGYGLVRVFFGGSRSPQSLELDDEALLTAVRGELRTLMGIEAPPLFHRIYRWQLSNPQYDVGHLERVAALEEGLPAGLHLAGSPYRGVGLPDCVRQGQEVAEQLLTERMPLRR